MVLCHVKNIYFVESHGTVPLGIAERLRSSVYSNILVGFYYRKPIDNRVYVRLLGKFLRYHVCVAWLITELQQFCTIRAAEKCCYLWLNPFSQLELILKVIVSSITSFHLLLNYKVVDMHMFNQD
jgi:hypothetical protein